jgi:hypothetical protein
MEEGIEPWEIAGDAPCFLISPCCHADVEEVKERAIVWKQDGEIVAGTVPAFRSGFCYCLKCGTNFFQVELLRMKSWRREFPKADILPETC